MFYRLSRLARLGLALTLLTVVTATIASARPDTPNYNAELTEQPHCRLEITLGGRVAYDTVGWAWKVTALPGTPYRLQRFVGGQHVLPDIAAAVVDNTGIATGNEIIALHNFQVKVLVGDMNTPLVTWNFDVPHCGPYNPRLTEEPHCRAAINVGDRTLYDVVGWAYRIDAPIGTPIRLERYVGSERVLPDIYAGTMGSAGFYAGNELTDRHNFTVWVYIGNLDVPSQIWVVNVAHCWPGTAELTEQPHCRPVAQVGNQTLYDQVGWAWKVNAPPGTPYRLKRFVGGEHVLPDIAADVVGPEGYAAGNELTAYHQFQVQVFIGTMDVPYTTWPVDVLHCAPAPTSTATSTVTSPPPTGTAAPTFTATASATSAPNTATATSVAPTSTLAAPTATATSGVPYPGASATPTATSSPAVTATPTPQGPQYFLYFPLVLGR